MSGCGSLEFMQSLIGQGLPIFSVDHVTFVQCGCALSISALTKLLKYELDFINTSE